MIEKYNEQTIPKWVFGPTVNAHVWSEYEIIYFFACMKKIWDKKRVLGWELMYKNKYHKQIVNKKLFL